MSGSEPGLELGAADGAAGGSRGGVMLAESREALPMKCVCARRCERGGAPSERAETDSAALILWWRLRCSPIGLLRRLRSRRVHRQVREL